MKKLLSIAVLATVAAGFAVAPADAKSKKRYHGAMNSMQQQRAPNYGNAALQGNNGNSGQGSNSLGHIQGGNIGAGK